MRTIPPAERTATAIDRPDGTERYAQLEAMMDKYCAAVRRHTLETLWKRAKVAHKRAMRADAPPGEKVH